MDYHNFSDTELITMLKEGKPSDNHAFNIIYMKYSSKFYGYCLYSAQSKEEADELMQDSWMKFYQAVKSGKTTNNILPLLFTIAKNLTINKFHQAKAKKKIPIQYFDSNMLDEFVDPFGFQRENDNDNLFQLIQIAINSLDEKYKEVILLHWFGEIKFPDIAQICGDSESAVRKRFERAMKKIDDILKPYLVQ